MSINKLALIRYRAIDECLQNKYRKWTLEDLIAKVAERLYEYEGIKTGISRRTIQADIQLMRSDKLGYNAPIIVREKKYYEYEEAGYSITKVPINTADVGKLKQAVSILKQLNGFSYFDEMSDMIARLENNLSRAGNAQANYIQFESNSLLKGLEHIMPLYEAISNKRALLLEYKSFKAQEAREQIYYPYLLKEYRNRWFLICKAKKSKYLVTLALDRIQSFHELLKETFVPYEGVSFERYFSDLLGVTKNETDRGNKVVLFVNAANAPYVLTKPLHPSQQVLKQDEKGIIIRIDVVLNFELEREILGFGEFVKVLAPRTLVGRIKRRVEMTARHYREQEQIAGADVRSGVQKLAVERE